MQERQYGRSPYLSALKTKDGSFFPKIHKAEPVSGNKFIAKSLRKKNYNQSIFKIKQQKPIIAKIQPVQDERVRESKQYLQLQTQIQQMQKKFKQQMIELQQNKQQISTKIAVEQRNSYQHKYGLWELKNQILQLEAMLKEDEEQYSRMLYDLGYDQGQGQYQQNQENGEQNESQANA